MLPYILRRLLLLPLTLFAIILVNFIILNLAPGDPVSATEMSSSGEATRSENTLGESHYLQFREHYGLTLPILFNTWPSFSKEKVLEGLTALSSNALKASQTHALMTLWGDRARFIMPLLLAISLDATQDVKLRRLATNLFIRGAYSQGKTGSTLTQEERKFNRKVATDNALVLSLSVATNDPQMEEKIQKLKVWFEKNKTLFPEALTFRQKAKIFFLKTRFYRYLSRVTQLDFGTLRNDSNKTVTSEVVKRMKYSLTLSLIPLVLTFVLCQVFGMCMALKQNKWPDYLLNTTFLILFAIPVFVVAPFLIEKVALGSSFLPLSGFQSPHYFELTSLNRLWDICLHLVLPLLAVTYGTLAIQSRLSRTTILEILRQDFVKMAKAKGLFPRTIIVKHIGRNAAITLVTALATSLGVILGGSLIVETIFEINGFGRFFYEAIVNHDYNVMLFSVFAGSFLTLIGYLLADISYTLLDPRVSLQ